ncbi:hypothetical protein F2P81_022829 [Scophthalmus maximus]|uniref:Uncharacterized protein n=1 Tax=Scophthalmus maximus TaxID=52904 RepID=A0A6A4S1C3_SCOMX|nr:hypothetical protein F2P81_022829 [Scophthalmus maximus]
MWKFADLVFQLQGGTFSGEQQEDSGRRHVTPSQPLSDVKLQFQVVAAEPKLESQSLLNKMKTNERREVTHLANLLLERHLLVKLHPLLQRHLLVKLHLLLERHLLERHLLVKLHLLLERHLLERHPLLQRHRRDPASFECESQLQRNASNKTHACEVCDERCSSIRDGVSEADWLLGTSCRQEGVNTVCSPPPPTRFSIDSHIPSFIPAVRTMQSGEPGGVEEEEHD